MILNLFIALTPVCLILLLSELLWRKKVIKGEKARKFIHILAGIWMALWPLYIPFDGIFILGSIALTILLYSRFTRLFHAIYAVKRKTYGEIFYALAIMVVAFLAQEPWIFTISILLLAVADGGAAVVGRYWGLANQYLVFGRKSLRKSISGTAAYLFLAYLSIFIGMLYARADSLLFPLQSNDLVALFIVLPIGATLLENITPYGLDNLATPVFAAILLNSLV